MCDECAFCGRAGWQAELRLTAQNELTCHDCHDADRTCTGDDCGWHDLLTPDELAEMNIAAMDDKAHAARDRRMGL